MLLLLPIMVFIAIFLNLLGGNPKWVPESKDWRKATLMASIFWGTLATIITEGLSLVKGLSSSWVIVAWAILLAVSIGVGWFSGAFRRTRESFQPKRDAFTSTEWMILLGILTIVITLAIVAWISPPQYDRFSSLPYATRCPLDTERESGALPNCLFASIMGVTIC